MLPRLLLLLLLFGHQRRTVASSTHGSSTNERTDPPGGSQSNSTSPQDLIRQHILKNYNSHERPTEGMDYATNVTVYMKILAINSVDVRSMEYTVDVYLRQAWVDPRLAWKNIPQFERYANYSIVSPSLKERLWLPDLFFRNGKEGRLHKMTLPNFLMRISSNGGVLYSQKITMRFSCQMELQTFPMDAQECDMNIGSYGYTLDQLKFVWRPEEPMKLPDKLQISEFNPPTRFETEDCTEGSAGSKTATGKYTCLRAYFKLQRQLGSYLATTYIPNVLIVMVSWLNFWVSIEAVPARITLGLLSLIGILTQASSVSSSLPRVSYIKSIDIWIIACIMFVIGALIEFAIASMLARRQKKESWQEDVRLVVRQELARWCAACQQQQIQVQATNHHNSHSTTTTSFAGVASRRQMEFCEELEGLLTTQVVSDRKEQKTTKTPPNNESDIDGYSRFLFPACFILYNCFYWLYYLVLVNHV